MWADFSAAGFLVHTPFGPPKSAMPESVELPAPANPPAVPALRNQHATRPAHDLPPPAHPPLALARDRSRFGDMTPEKMDAAQPIVSEFDRKRT